MGNDKLNHEDPKLKVYIFTRTFLSGFVTFNDGVVD